MPFFAHTEELIYFVELNKIFILFVQCTVAKFLSPLLGGLSRLCHI
jgi:hypothetical protein